MPANLTPVYKAAEERFRQAKTKEEKLDALEEMLAVIPKHKGTDHLQADIKRRMAKLREDDDSKGGLKTADPFLIPKEGAGQAVLMGYPNTGKSSLVGALTRAKVAVGDYPFTTVLPVSGMMACEDILIQLVDLPPVSEGEMPRGMAGTLRLADLIIILVDAGSDECLSQLQGSIDLLSQRRILVEKTDTSGGTNSKTTEDLLVVATKADLSDAAERLEMLKEITPSGWQFVVSSIHMPESLMKLRKTIFERLRVVRVYSKIPGKDPEMEKPFVLKTGQTVLDFAEKVHRDFPGKLKYAKVWGSARFPGQSVEKDYQLADRDIVELHV